MQRDSMHQGLKTTTTKIKRISFFDSLYFDEKLMQSIALEKRGLLYCIGRRGGSLTIEIYFIPVYPYAVTTTIFNCITRSKTSIA